MSTSDPTRPSAWKPARPAPLLEPEAIHVWQVPLTGSAQMIHDARALLEPSEIARADRFVFEKHQQRFALGRAAVRRILGAYLDQPPAEIRFRYEALGKPRLAHGQAGTGLCFNFSNSHQLGLLAVTRDAEVGVDLEWNRELLDMMGLAQRFFCEEEISKLTALTGRDRQSAFFRLWTRKEAFLKAVGKGLTFPLNHVEVSCLAEEPVEIRWINGEAPGHWNLSHLLPRSGYTGAVARQRLGDRVECFVEQFG